MRPNLTLALRLVLLACLAIGCQKALVPGEDHLHPTLAAWTLMDRQATLFGLETEYQRAARGLHALKRDQLCQTALERSYEGLTESKSYSDDFESLLDACIACAQGNQALEYVESVAYTRDYIRLMLYLARHSNEQSVADEALKRALSSLDNYRTETVRMLSQTSASERALFRDESHVSELLLLSSENHLHSQDLAQAKATLQEAINFGIVFSPELARSAVVAHRLNLRETRDDCLKRSAVDDRTRSSYRKYAQPWVKLSRIEALYEVGQTAKAQELLGTITDQERPVPLNSEEAPMLVNLTSEYMSPVLKTIVGVEGEHAALDYIEHVRVRRALQSLAPHLTQKETCLRALEIYRELESRSQEFDDKPEDPPYFLVPALSQHYPATKNVLAPLVTESLSFAISQNRPEQIKILNLVGLAAAQHSIPVTDEQVEILQKILKSELSDTP